MATLYGIAYQGYYTRSGTLYTAALDAELDKAIEKYKSR